jgi:hypothetical protein
MLRLSACRIARGSAVRASENSAPVMPQPSIKIDNTTDPFATVVKVDFGDRLGELLDTVRAAAAAADRLPCDQPDLWRTTLSGTRPAPQQ